MLSQAATGREANRIEEINSQKKKSFENAKTPQQRYKHLHGLMKIHFESAIDGTTTRRKRILCNSDTFF